MVAAGPNEVNKKGATVKPEVLPENSIRVVASRQTGGKAAAVMRTQRGLDGLVPQHAGDLAGLERASCVVAHVSLCGDVHKQCEK